MAALALELKKEVEAGGPLATLYGLGAGALGFVGVGIPKAVVDVIAWLAGFFGADTRPIRLTKGIIDLALGGVIAYDAYTQKRDDFWKAAEWSFSILELIAGGVITASALADYITGALGETSLDMEIDKKVVELLTGKRYEK
jgi:hypothetical protein